MQIQKVLWSIALCTFSLHAAIFDDVAEKVEQYESHYFHHKKHTVRRHHGHHIHYVSREEQWQRALHFLGYYNGKMNGDLLTPESYDAIERFQHTYQESATGLLDNCYKPYLSDIYKKLAMKKYLDYTGQKRDLLNRKKQAVLKTLGYYHGKIDGHFGKQSKAALQNALNEGKSEAVLETEAREKVHTALSAMKAPEYFASHYAQPDNITSSDDDL
jgi:hypothetical protein